MTEQEALNHKIDRTGWDPGPWDSEPDRVDFESNGFACMLIRANLGHWCGYAGVPEGHKYFGKDYSHRDVDVSAHGGLTYSGLCSGGICHVPKPGMPEKVWWLGFDCAHMGDLVPGMVATSRRIRQTHIMSASVDDLYGRDTYRDMGWVKRQTKRLAKQLSEV